MIEKHSESECNAVKSSRKVFLTISQRVSREASLFIDFDREHRKCRMQIVLARTRGKARRTLGSWLVSKVIRTSTSFPGSGNHDLATFQHIVLRVLSIPFLYFSSSLFSLLCSNKRSEQRVNRITVQFVYY